MKIYLTSPLFSEAKRATYRSTKARIEAEMGGV
jgi:nucleoside 2-deoxyribosyltransferase